MVRVAPTRSPASATQTVQRLRGNERPDAWSTDADGGPARFARRLVPRGPGHPRAARPRAAAVADAQLDSAFLAEATRVDGTIRAYRSTSSPHGLCRSVRVRTCHTGAPSAPRAAASLGRGASDRHRDYSMLRPGSEASIGCLPLLADSVLLCSRRAAFAAETPVPTARSSFCRVNAARVPIRAQPRPSAVRGSSRLRRRR